jgi:GTP-binding protein
MRTKTKFILSGVAPEHFPVSERPEIAFIGRSNVGKSSLINAMVGTKTARVSSKPGLTTTINFYEVDVARNVGPFYEIMIADLPGYGYARVSKRESAGWSKFVDPYLAGREQLKAVVVLVDSTIQGQVSDFEMVDWLNRANRQFILVATKSDKISPSRRLSEINKLGDEFGAKILPVSSTTGDGVEDLWRLILSVCRK